MAKYRTNLSKQTSSAFFAKNVWERDCYQVADNINGENCHKEHCVRRSFALQSQTQDYSNEPQNFVRKLEQQQRDKL